MIQPATVTSALPPLQSLADLHAIEAVPLEERELARTTYDLLAHAAARWPEEEAVVFVADPVVYATSVTWTFAELRKRIDRIAAVLTSLGVERSSPVTLISPNTGDLLAATLAAEAVGIAAPANPAFDVERIGHLLRTTGSRHLVAAGPELDPGLWARLVDAADSLGLVALLALRPDAATGAGPALGERDGVRIAYLDDLAAAAEPAPLAPDRRPTPEDVAAYFCTGGTTGEPKVAAHTHANEAITAWSIAVACGMDAGDTVLAGLPLFHVNALMVTTLAPLVGGGRAVWPGPNGYRDPALYRAFWKLVEHYRPCAMSAVPTVYAALSAIPVDADISSLIYPVVGAAPLPVAVRSAFKARTGLDLYEGYGLTEATCASTATPPGQGRAGTVGRRLPYQSVKAVEIDEHGSITDLGPGEVGEILISGPAVFAGYLTTTPTGRTLSMEGHVVGGCLRTGDLGSIGEDQYVTLSGRSKDLIIRGGHNIDPRVIEDALLTHPDVTAAAAVGRPDRASGEIPVAYAVLTPGAAVTAEDLVSWAAEHIDEPAARPKSVTLLPALPTTEVGKPFKPRLREDAARAVAEVELAAAGITGPEIATGHQEGRLTLTLTGTPAAVASGRRVLSGLPLDLVERPL